MDADKLKGIMVAVKTLRDLAEVDKECHITLTHAADILEREAKIAYGDKNARPD